MFFSCCRRDNRDTPVWHRIRSLRVYILWKVLLCRGDVSDSCSGHGRHSDTIDAISSYGDREKKLQILKDPHTGAFAVIGLCVYFVAVLALWSEAESYMLPIAACMYPLSRALSGISVVSFHPAKNSGLLRTFQDGAQKKRVRIVLIIWACICGGIMLYLGWQQGGAFVAGAAAVIAAALLVFAYYHRMSRKKFGGTTGDLAGYFLQMCELAMLAVIVLVGKII